MSVQGTENPTKMICAPAATKRSAVLGQAQVDLGHRSRRPLLPVATRVIHVDVEPVLVGDVLVDLTAAAEAEISDHHSRRLRVSGAVLADHAHEEPHQRIGAVEAVRLDSARG